ncbi:ABC-2 type transport system ATP-binding protein [Dyadobacter soli]|uniref:ABC-2 type transport system ATP-binding protein n=1 Tax=Dyadobacter soli TaxID=659014 RepID=A0A1G6VM97_9BACT|nr:ATP-binding cassette domain-containing protein [Dyadobacter soli]SDD54005.1 ABC-2 type transport system ATP-binding protein [Dyadobacter soli]
MRYICGFTKRSFIVYILETKALSHQFGAGEPVVRNLDLKIPQGSIYGFLGPNGAGKTTTLRLMLGLIKKQSGQIEIFARPLEHHREQTLRQIGSMIDSPSFYGHLSAYENLLVFQKIFQCPKSRISEVLHLVGLSRTGSKKASRFSLGMKQRLGIAIALLHNPSLLILDEPTNGLDPNGMIEIREMLIRLNRQQGISILISSHLLGEMQKLVTHVGIINAGKLVYEGTLDKLVSKSGQSFQATWEIDHTARAMEIVGHKYNAVKLDDQKIVIADLTRDQIGAVNRELIVAGIPVYEITTSHKDLESIFMNLITNNNGTLQQFSK